MRLKRSPPLEQIPHPKRNRLKIHLAPELLSSFVLMRDLVALAAMGAMNKTQG